MNEGKPFLDVILGRGHLAIAEFDVENGGNGRAAESLAEIAGRMAERPLVGGERIDFDVLPLVGDDEGLDRGSERLPPHGRTDEDGIVFGIVDAVRLELRDVARRNFPLSKSHKHIVVVGIGLDRLDLEDVGPQDLRYLPRQSTRIPAEGIVHDEFLHAIPPHNISFIV